MAMKSVSRRSLLQMRILLRLEVGPFRAISELAMAVGARRPSVSRSLKTLRNDKLVVRNRDGWILTFAGEEEAKRCHQELSRVADNLHRTVQGISIASLAEVQRPLTGAGETVQSIASLAEVQRTLLGVGEMVQSITSSAEVQRTLLGVGEVVQSITSSAEVQRTLIGIGEMVQSLAPLAETHHALSGAIARSMAVPNLGLIISRNNAMVARAIENIQSVCSAPDIRMHGFDKVLYPGVLRDIQDIGASHHTLLSEIAVASEGLSEIQHSWSRMLVPSSTVANFTHSLRSEVAFNRETDGVPSPRIPDRENPKEVLERLLTDLNPDLVDKWQGSWQVLRESSPDRLSQSAFSYRELIRMVLDELAPDFEVDRSKQRSKRKMQVRHVLDGSEADFAGAMVEALPKLYDFLSKPSHTSYRNEVAVQAALMAGDGLLLILLSNKRVYQS